LGVAYALLTLLNPFDVEILPSGFCADIIDVLVRPFVVVLGQASWAELCVLEFVPEFSSRVSLEAGVLFELYLLIIEPFALEVCAEIGLDPLAIETIEVACGFFTSITDVDFIDEC
jgi:hypothetical protein